jgi:hypothetical protein
MAIRSVQIALNNATATALMVAGDGTGTTFKNLAGTATDPLPVTIGNTDAAIAIWIGGPGVTAATGTKLLPGASQSYQMVGDPAISDIFYAIAASATPNASVMIGRQ